ncbi:transcription antitermination factor NusB [Desulfobacterales bacterium HSG16]|nr:transcription antitermination factor NusB [Desulfobacterales bacterium HSG16]
MGYRRKARELAMQALFYMDTSTHPFPRNLDMFCESRDISQKVLPFFLDLARSVAKAESKIDEVIERFSDNWKVSRMSGVDRNVIRIAVYEMVCCDDIPHKVSINEAIEVGKKFGSEESGAFINGILDGIRLRMEKEPIRIIIPEGNGEASVEKIVLDDLQPANKVKRVSYTRVKGKPGVLRRRSTKKQVPVLDKDDAEHTDNNANK